MRVALVTVAILGLALYAWRDWFLPLCVLIVMTAVMKHDDMPRTVMGIQGLNPWNLLLLVIFLSWLTKRRMIPSEPRTPAALGIVLFCFLGVIVIAYLRGVVDVGSIRSDPSSEAVTDKSVSGFTADFLINPLKYTVATVLLFDGARSGGRLLLGLGAIFAQTALYAFQVVKHIPLGTLLLPYNPFRDRLARECGLQANDMALVMVVTTWGLIVCLLVLREQRRWLRFAGVFLAVLCFMALLLTQSRGGYLALAIVGLALGFWRWRVLLLLLPAAFLVTALVVPSVLNRVTEGFGVTDTSGQQTGDLDAISAGRLTNLYPPTLEEIAKSPLIGHGRFAIYRTSVFDRILALEGNVPTHPHNAYLEMLLDCGIIGLLATLAVYMGFPCLAVARFRSRDPILLAATGTGLVAAVTILVMGMSGQTFFPREGIFVVTCAYALMMRAYIVGRYNAFPQRR